MRECGRWGTMRACGIAKASCEIWGLREREVEEVERDNILKFYTCLTRVYVLGDKNPSNQFKQRCESVK